MPNDDDRLLGAIGYDGEQFTIVIEDSIVDASDDITLEVEG